MSEPTQCGPTSQIDRAITAFSRLLQESTTITELEAHTQNFVTSAYNLAMEHTPWIVIDFKLDKTTAQGRSSHAVLSFLVRPFRFPLNASLKNLRGLSVR